jgi:hypothetical protein
MTVQYDFKFQPVDGDETQFCQVVDMPVTASGSISAAQLSLVTGGIWYNTGDSEHHVTVTYRVISGGYPVYTSSDQTVHLTAAYFQDIFGGAQSVSAGDTLEVILSGHGVNIPAGLTVSITA